MSGRHSKVTNKLHQLIESKDTHPFARWSVIDPNAAPECAALRDKAWRVDGVALAMIVDEHIGANIKGCRCNLVGMTRSSLNTSVCRLMD